MAIKKEKTFAEKMQGTDPEFCDDVQGLNVAQLEARLSLYAKESQKNDEAKAIDKDLKLAKDQAREFGAPYRETAKALRMKNKYIVQLIRDKGGNV